MRLHEYPRPPKDNGRGIHWFPTLAQGRDVVDRFVPLLPEMKIRWVVFLNGLDAWNWQANEYLVRSLVTAGIMPIMRVFTQPLGPYERGTLSRLADLIRFYSGISTRVLYVQLFNEPNRVDEWPGRRFPSDPVEAFLDAWIPAAETVMDAGGLPGLAPLAPGGHYDDLEFLARTLDGIIARGKTHLFDRMWVAIHNYTMGHPPAYEADSNGFKKFLWVNRIITQRLQRPLPLLTTEGGTRLGTPPLGDGVDEATVAQHTADMFAFMATAPEYYFCICPWLLGNMVGGGTDPSCEASAWYRRDGSVQPVVAAVRALPDAERPRPDDQSGGSPGATRERYFGETGHWVRGAFLDFFDRYGLDLCGYPSSDQGVENGLPTQYFQRVIMEEYRPGTIRLRLAGDEVKDLRARLAESQARLESAINEITRLMADLAALQSRADALAAEKANLVSQVTQLQGQLVALQAHAANLQIQLDQAQTLIVQLTTDKRTLQQQVSQLQMQVNTLQGQLADAQARVQTLAAENTTLQNQVATLQQMVADLQRRLGTGRIQRPPIQDVVDQLPTSSDPTNRYATRSLQDIRYLAIHHTGTDDLTVTPYQVAYYHVNDPNHLWPGIGYHFFITPDGTIFQTNRLETISYHVANNNPPSVGICLVGKFTTYTPTSAQMASCAWLCAWLLQELKLEVEAIRGHRDYPNQGTTCPGTQWDSGQAYKTSLLTAIQARRQQVGKTLYHYLLFWQTATDWARQNWADAGNYIGRFRVTSGFSVDDAMNAQNVTIVGGTEGVSAEAEQRLRTAGCYVERITGPDHAAIKAILDDLAQRGQRFLTPPPEQPGGQPRRLRLSRRLWRKDEPPEDHDQARE